jgi:hypothetical protein
VHEDAAAIKIASIFSSRRQVVRERPPQKHIAELDDEIERSLSEDVDAELARGAVAAEQSGNDHVAEAIHHLVGEGITQAAAQKFAGALPQRLRVELGVLPDAGFRKQCHAGTLVSACVLAWASLR